MKSASNIKFIDIPDIIRELKQYHKTEPVKLTINQKDLSVIKELFPAFFKDASVYEYWSDNKLGELNKLPVYAATNAKQSATLYWL